MAAGYTVVVFKDGNNASQNGEMYFDGANLWPAPFARTNSIRNAGAVYRSGITAPDTLVNQATFAAVGATVSGGSLVPASTYAFTIAARNAYGTTVVPTVASVSPGSTNNTLYITVPQCTGPNGAVATNYDVFLSLNSAGTAVLWVCSFSEAQRAAGGWTCNVVGTPLNSGAAPAGAIGIGVVGTGQAANLAQFQSNTAIAFPAASAIACTGYSTAHVEVNYSITDVRAISALTITPFFQSQQDSAYYVGDTVTVPLGGTPGAAFKRDIPFQLDGAVNAHFLVTSLSGQGASVTLNVELA